MTADPSFLREWADLGDNRLGPILKELVEATIEDGDPDKIYRLANRLKFLSSSMHSYCKDLAKETAE